MTFSVWGYYRNVMMKVIIMTLIALPLCIFIINLIYSIIFPHISIFIYTVYLMTIIIL